MLRDKEHYLRLLERNPNATVGFSLAAKMVIAARGFGDDRAVCLRLKRTYGEILTPEEVRKEMGCE